MRPLGTISPLINRRRIGAVAAVAVLLAAGCGDDSGDDDNSGANPGTPEATTDDPVAEGNSPAAADAAAGAPADLQSVMLSIDDMPAGWSVLPEDNDAEQVCGNPRPAGRITFIDDPQNGPVVGHVVDADPNWYDATAQAFSSCDTTDAEGNTWRGSDLAAPQVGERSQGFRMTVTDPAGRTQTSDVVLYEVNGVAGGVLASAGNTTSLLAEYAPVAAGLAE
jgi:hypothetical protein